MSYGGNTEEFYYKQISNAYIEENKLFILEKSFYVYNDWNDYVNKVSVFSNYDRKSLIDYFEKDANEALNIDTDKNMKLFKNDFN